MADVMNFLPDMNLTGVLGQFFYMSTITLFVFVILLVLFLWARNKALYRIPVSLEQVLENGTFKTRHDLLGRNKKTRTGVMDFVIKVPKQMRKKCLGYVPDFSLADSDGRLHFTPIGDGMLWQQVKKKLITEKEIEKEIEINQEELDNLVDHFSKLIIEKYPDKSESEKEEILKSAINAHLDDNKKTETVTYSLISEPIPTDIKTVTINAIQSAENILEKNKLTAFAIGIGAFLIMLVAQIVFLWFTTK